MVILYGNKLWLTHSEDISLKTLRVLICSKEALTLFEAQIQWEKSFPGAHCVEVQGACLSSLMSISKVKVLELYLYKCESSKGMEKAVCRNEVDISSFFLVWKLESRYCSLP